MTPSVHEYRVVPGFRPLLLDLHRPAPDDRPAPLVVFVHGGGWAVGTRAGFGPEFGSGTAPGDPFARLTAAGLAVASVDYRLSGEARFPAPVSDVAAALGWLREHGAEVGVDGRRPVLWGESAGAHLAALVALADTDGSRGAAGPGVAAVVDWYGPSDLAALPGDVADLAAAGISSPVDPAAPDSRESRLLGVPLPDAGDLAAAASPAHHVHPGAPPFLLLHGTADRLVPAAQSRRLAEALVGAGAAVEHREIEGADHLWRGTPAAAEEAFTRSLAFAREHLGRG